MQGGALERIDEEVAVKPNPGPGGVARAVLTVVAAGLAAVNVVLLARIAEPRIGLAAAIALGGLALAGALALVAWATGFLHSGRPGTQRAFFDAVADAIDDPIVVTDQRGRAIYANKAFRSLAEANGHSRLIGVENLYAGFPDAADKIYRLAQAARDGRAAEEKLRLAPGSGAPLSRAGRPSWIAATVRPASGPGNVYALWRLSDATDERDREEAAFSHLQYIINYLDHAPAGFFSTQPDGQIAYVNATLAGWLGLDLAQTTDGTLTLADLVGPDSAKLIARIDAEPGSVRTETFDIDLQSKDGRTVPVRIIHRADYDASGQAQPSRSLVLDRLAHDSDRVSAEAESRIARLINNAPIGIVQVGRDGSIANFNTAFAAMAPRGARGASFGQSVHPDHVAAVAKAVADAFAGAPPAEPLDVTFAGDPGHSAQLFFGRFAPGEGESLTVYAIDTTQHASLEVQLAQSRKMLAIGQLAGGIAHDFNNVLTAIIGFSDLLLARHKPTDPSFADIMNIKQNANRAANLVRQLLAFSRRQTLRPEVTSLTDIISDLGNLLGRLLGEKIELKIVHGRDVGLVKVDVNQFEQVVINLAVNARDAMPNGGALVIRTQNITEEESRLLRPGLVPPGDYVLFEVEDTGTGMPPEVLEKIFEPFFTTKEVGKGTGLGLSTVYGIIKQTGGFVFCDSEVGRGTTFRIYLPRHAEAERKEPLATAQEPAKEAKPADLTGKGTILLVEDEDAVRSFASRALQSRGYTVLTAETGERALAIVEDKGSEIDLVLSDVVMPEMDGPTLLKEMRKRGHTTRVVFISGYAEDAFEKNLEGATDFAFLPKPFTLKQLAEAVKQAMSG
jgi:two-component system cell cycle sensor histidine kinase/response regulator CckA